MRSGLFPAISVNKDVTVISHFCSCSLTQLLSNSLWPHGLQNTRLPCPSQDPGACSNSCPLSQWCHPTISSSVVPFSSCLQSFPASGSFLMSQLFASGSQSIGALASGSVLLMNIQGWFPLGRTGLISLLSRTLKSSPTPQFKSINSLMPSLLYVQLSHPNMTIEKKTIARTRWTFVGKVMSLPFNMLSRFVVAFLPRRKHFLISWLQSPSAVILESKKIKSVTVSIVSPSICYEVMGLDVIIFTDWMLSFQSAFSLSSFPFINRLFSSSSHQPLWSSDMSCEPWGLKKENTHHLVVIRLQPLSTLSLEELRIWKQDTDPQRAEMHQQSDDFRESRVFHLPIHRKALNSLTWVIWFSLTDNHLLMFRGLPGGSAGKESACNAEDLVPSPGWEKGMATQSVFWPGEFHGLYRVGHDWASFIFDVQTTYILLQKFLYNLVLPLTSLEQFSQGYLRRCL